MFVFKTLIQMGLIKLFLQKTKEQYLTNRERETLIIIEQQRKRRAERRRRQQERASSQPTEHLHPSHPTSPESVHLSSCPGGTSAQPDTDHSQPLTLDLCPPPQYSDIVEQDLPPSYSSLKLESHLKTLPPYSA